MRADKTGKNGPTLPVPIEEEEAKRRLPRRRRRRAAAAAAAATPLRRRQPRRPRRHPSSTTPSRSRFLRRCRRAPASRTSSSATRRTRSISGSSIWPRTDPLQFTGRGSADIAAERHGRCHGRRELRPGRMVGHLQAAASRKRGRPVRARRVSADRLLGLGRVLARAWQQARSHVVVLDLRRAGSGPIGRRPDGEDGADYSRHRAGRDRLGAAALCAGAPAGIAR